MIRELTVRGVYAENCYFYIDDVSKAGFLIDPGAQAGVILEVIQRNGWKIEKILLTHGHFDHMGAAELLREKLVAPIYLPFRRHLSHRHISKPQCKYWESSYGASL